MRMLKFATLFACLIVLPMGVLTGHAGISLVSGLVVGALIYLVLRFISMPFRP